MDERHGTTKPKRLRDPYLGWRWVLVGCDWCGAKNRYRTKTEAEQAAQRHNSSERSPSNT